MDLIEQYTQAVTALLARVTTDQRPELERVGALVADSVLHGGCAHVYDTGHIINNELINRSGGLYLFRPLKYTLQVENPARPRDRSDLETSQEGLAEYVLRASNVRPGDVLFIGSVSGKSASIVDLALCAKKFGVTTVAVTSRAYSSGLTSSHSSGKRLYEACDFVLDNGAPFGDAMLKVEGVANPVFPASGFGSTAVMWCVCACVIERLTAAGVEPNVFLSINGPEGAEDYRRRQAEYEKIGY